MDRALVVDASERDGWTRGSFKRGGWLSFVWAGSLMGIIGELLLSNAFHGDLKEDNIVGSQVDFTNSDPFTFIWNAIDWGGAGKSNNRSDFESSMYTPHYQPIRPIPTGGKLRDYISSHDVIAMAHIVRNVLMFMISSANRKTPYSSQDNTTRFFSTEYGKRGVLTGKVLSEISQMISERH